METATIDVPDISCDHCKQAIESAVQPLHGVDQATVDVPSRTVTVTYDAGRTPRETIVEAIIDQGFDVP